MHQSKILICLIAAFVVAACGGSGGGGYPTGTTTNPGNGNPSPSPGTTNTVTLSEATFQPGTLTVPKSTTVTWKWASCTDGGYGGYSGCVTHSVTFDDGSGIASPTQSEGTFTRTFNSSGTFKYHCAIHGTAMVGQVTVQ
jgi:plastocyanin